MKAEARLRFCRLIFLKVRNLMKLLVFVDLPKNPCVDDDMVLHVVVGHPNAPVSYLFMTKMPFVNFQNYVNVFLATGQVAHLKWDLMTLQKKKQMIVLYLSLSDSHSVVVHLVLCELFVLKTRGLFQLSLFVNVCLF